MSDTSESNAAGPVEASEPESPEWSEHADHLARSARVWDRWSDRYGLSERDFEPIRARTIELLDLGAGDRVLDVGCGPGTNSERLRAAVGPDGEVVGVDYSPRMVERARERVAERGWTNVEVRRADATSDDLGADFDAAVATLSLSVTPDVHRAVENVRSALAADGQFAAFGLRPVPSGPARVLNPLLRRCLYWIANWNPDADVVAALEDAFERYEVVETYAAGVGFVALASDRDGPRDA